MAKKPRGSGDGKSGDESPHARAASDASERLGDDVVRASRLVTVVGCGASAGGLEAFSQLLAALPVDVNAAFVLIPHLAPEHASMMAQLLQHQTRLPVAEITHRMALESGHVYVAPPGMNVDVRERKLHLSPRQDGGVYHPIDHCFR